MSIKFIDRGQELNFIEGEYKKKAPVYSDIRGKRKSCLKYYKENKILTFDLNQMEEIFAPH
ncbi:MAG: hypothetical protein BME93_02345 [Methanosarcinales archaeon Met12]|nr:MAG: hypothetical protein BME93_02345 [Methanosarcinales archaeon Met12]